MPKVFIAQFMPQLNFQQAEDYGEVTFLTEREYRPEPVPPGYNDAIVREITGRLTDYIPGEDFIVVTGSSLPNLIIGAYLISRPGVHKILKWSNMRKGYDLHKFKTPCG